MSTSPWPSDWLRGVLEVCVLQVLADGPTYGYAIATRLESLGLGAIKGGTLYPLLGRFEESGLVTVEWRAGAGGPGRKYFTLTGAGNAYRVAQSSAWTRFATLTTAIVTTDPAPLPDPANPQREDAL
jgi:PadR family transcriptional regulator PadR